MKEMTYAFPKIKEIDPSCYIDAYTIIAECSQASSPRAFVSILLELLEKACPYDEAVAFFLNSNGIIESRYLVRAKPERLDAFVSYYLDVLADEFPSHNFYMGKREGSGAKFTSIIDWKRFPDSEFKRDYIEPHKLQYSWGFAFFDQMGAYRVVLSLDRTKDIPFNEAKKNRLGMALPILNNMYRSFFYQAMEMDTYFGHMPWEKYGLTKRERQIADLLCQGMKATTISTALNISVATTYKHISNIFKKTKVKSQQELVVKLINRKSG